MASVNTTDEKINPFPGLRPFTTGENDYFFGRESESDEIVRKLIKTRFVAVTGSSGSGKSSLIHCGVIPELKKQTLKGGASWRVLSVKPGNNPTGILADAFVNASINPEQNKSRKDEILKILRENPDGITAVLKKFPVKEGERTLLIIDQFEELFRYGSPETGKGYSIEASDVINLIANSITGENHSFYTIIALRSDLVAECAQFKVFTQLVNNSNFLVPMMSRESVREAITGPLKNAGAKIDEDLVDVLLDDLNDRTDQLPVLQHALMRTWNRWKELEEPEKPVSISDYESIGTMKGAISRHADEEYEKLGPEAKKICEKLFKIITGKGSDNKGIRYPSNIRTIISAIACTRDELSDVIDKFRQPSLSVLTPYYDVPLDDDTIIDLSHESLIWLWDRLKKWVDEEAASVQMYLHLSEASALYQQGKTGLIRQPDLQPAIKWREQNKPTLWWAQKYNPAFERAMVYLRTSEKEYLEAEELKARQHRWRLNRIRILSSFLGGIALITVLSLAAVSLSKVNSDRQRRVAEKQKEEFAAQKSWAEQYAAIAVKRSVESDSAANAATQRELTEKELREAAEKKVYSAKQDAYQARKLQALTLNIAETNAKTALEQKNETQRLRMISAAKSMSLRSLQVSGQKDLQALLAYQAYLFNKKNNGQVNDADVYAGLYNVAKIYGSSQYRTFSGHEGQVTGIAFIPGTREFFTSGTDGRVLRWNLDKKDQGIRIVYSNSEVIDVMTVSPNADWLACGEGNAGIKMIPVNGGGTPYELKGHSGKIKSLVFSFDGKSLYSAALDGKVLKWDLTARKSTALGTDMIQISSIDLSSTGRYLAGISNEGKALVWNQDANSDKFRIESPGKTIKAIRFKPDEERIAVGYNDGTIEIWDIATRTKTNEFIAHNGEISNIRFNSKHLQMATTGNDGNLKLWDTSDLTALPVSFNDNGGIVIAFDFSPDGEVILSGSFEGKPQITGRPAYADAFAADGCNYVTRNFTAGEWLAHVGRDIDYEKTCQGVDTKIKIREIR